jgi:hypothetical protein
MAGFEVSKAQGATGMDGIIQTYSVDAAHATILAPGDAVVVTGDADTDGQSEVDTGNAATANTGVIVSVDYTLSGEQLSNGGGLAASTAGTVKVQIDPQMLYEIETDATLTVADIDLNVGINVTAATTAGGLTTSNMTADSGTVAVTQTLPYRIVRLLEGKTSGVLGDRVLVRPNATTQADGALGIA